MLLLPTQDKRIKHPRKVATLLYDVGVKLQLKFEFLLAAMIISASLSTAGVSKFWANDGPHMLIDTPIGSGWTRVFLCLCKGFNPFESNLATVANLLSKKCIHDHLQTFDWQTYDDKKRSGDAQSKPQWTTCTASSMCTRTIHLGHRSIQRTYCSARSARTNGEYCQRKWILFSFSYRHGARYLKRPPRGSLCGLDSSYYLSLSWTDAG